MIINPSTTGLLLIGASEFDNDNITYGRKSFKHSHREVKRYFADELDIPQSNRLDLFNSPSTASEQIEMIGDFLVDNPIFTDLFVYVVSHGRIPGEQIDSAHGFLPPPDYLLRVNMSFDDQDGDPDVGSYLSFRKLFDTTFGGGSMRVFFIVDACHSGLVHDLQLRPIVKPTSLNLPAEGRRKGVSEAAGHFDARKRDAMFLTATSAPTSENGGGLAYGADRAELTMFTFYLLETLRKGVEGFGAGLSFSVLSYFINEASKEKSEELEAPVCDVSQVSNYNSALESSPLSDEPIFPNNDEHNRLINQDARRIRRQYLESAREAVERQKAEAKNLQLQEENEALSGELEESTESVSRLTAEIERYKGEAGAEIRQLQDANKALAGELEESTGSVSGLNAEVERHKGRADELERVQRRILWFLGLGLPTLMGTILLFALTDFPSVIVQGAQAVLSN